MQLGPHVGVKDLDDLVDPAGTRSQLLEDLTLTVEPVPVKGGHVRSGVVAGPSVGRVEDLVVAVENQLE